MPRKSKHKRLQSSIHRAHWKNQRALVVELSRDYLIYHPDDATVWICLGHALTKLYRYEEAERALSIELAPGYEKLQQIFWRERGELERRRGNLEEAKEWFGRALESDGLQEDPDLQVDLGYLNLRLGHLSEGEAHFRSALESSDFESKGAGLYRLGQVLRAQNRIEEALECFRQAAAHDPKFKPLDKEIRELEEVLLLRLMRSSVA